MKKMRMRKVTNRSTAITYKGQKNSGPKLVETAGYIPAKIQIENMMIAGFRLDQARKLKYDYESQNEQMEAYQMDPTRRPGYDPADAIRDARTYSEKLLQQANLAKAKKEEERINKAFETSIAEGKPEGK